MLFCFVRKLGAGRQLHLRVCKPGLRRRDWGPVPPRRREPVRRACAVLPGESRHRSFGHTHRQSAGLRIHDPCTRMTGVWSGSPTPLITGSKTRLLSPQKPGRRVCSDGAGMRPTFAGAPPRAIKPEPQDRQDPGHLRSRPLPMGGTFCPFLFLRPNTHS